MNPPVNFAKIPRVSFTAAEPTTEDGGEVPESMTFKTAQRRMAMLQEARDIVAAIPGPGQALHGVMTGRYDLMMLLVAILDAYPCQCREMRIATLSYNKRNLAEMVRLLDSGQVPRLTLLCSSFFREHNTATFEETLQEFSKRPAARLAAARSHAKVVTMAFEDGARLALEGSANLRTNSNREQFCLIHSPELHDWHAAWIDDLVRKHEVNQSDDSATG